MARDFARKLGDSEEYFIIKCLQDQLDRKQIGVKLDIKSLKKATKVKKTNHYRACRAYAQAV
jgi:hypothetical protein